ncbi:TonB-dependent receptor plug domain-containing protein [Methylobacterium sp. J-088]|uniref:TonB-dependent receptor plug domain-containing protein n=1 Tax=Methylobacterium sp. J-088 TaxID=2836664 RepID=UPI00391DBBF8
MVTSNKREQRLDRVDSAVSVATEARLADNDVRDVGDLHKVLPNTVIANRGNRAYANFTLRGIAAPNFYNPAVQVYVDGVPQASANLAQDLFDVSRVELLRGPQGTLYGMNAFAYVLNIITEKPRVDRVDVFATASERLFEIGTATTRVLVPDTLFLDLGLKERYGTGQIRSTIARSNARSARWPADGRCWSSPIASPPSWMPTGSWCWTRAGSSKAATTPRCSPGAAATPASGPSRTPMRRASATLRERRCRQLLRHPRPRALPVPEPCRGGAT